MNILVTLTIFVIVTIWVIVTFRVIEGLRIEEMVTFELIPENEDQRLPKKPQVQSCITQFFKLF